MTSRLGTLVTFTNTLSLMEARRKNVLKFPLQISLTVLSVLMNGFKNCNIQGKCENLFEM